MKFKQKTGYKERIIENKPRKVYCLEVNGEKHYMGSISAIIESGLVNISGSTLYHHNWVKPYAHKNFTISWGKLITAPNARKINDE